MRRLILVFGCLFTSTACAQAPAPIDRLVRDYMEREHVPGVAVVALQDERMLLSQSWGFADVANRAPMSPGAVQPIYSISKHMTAADLLSLAEQGKLDVRDPVARVLVGEARRRHGSSRSRFSAATRAGGFRAVRVCSCGPQTAR